MGCLLKRKCVMLIWLCMGMPAICLANMGIPGPLMWLGVNTGLGYRWLCIAMFTCVAIEGMIFQFAHALRRPYRASITLNVISLVVGMPIVGTMIWIGTMFDESVGSDTSAFWIEASIASIVVEALAALLMLRTRLIGGSASSRKRIFGILVVGNALSNVALFALSNWMFNLYPSKDMARMICRQNAYQLQNAAWEYMESNGITNNDLVRLDFVVPWLPEQRMPMCPFGGMYCYDAADGSVWCSHRRTDRPVKRGAKPKPRHEAVMPIVGAVLDMHDLDPADVRAVLPQYLEICRRQKILNVWIAFTDRHYEERDVVNGVLKRLPIVTNFLERSGGTEVVLADPDR